MPRAKGGFKVCTKCGEKKSVLVFSTDNSTPDRLHTRCKACARVYYIEHREEMLAQHKDYHKRNKTRKRITPEHKFCPRCEELKPSSEFCKDSSRADGLSYWCRACHKAQHEVYYEDEEHKLLSLAQHKVRYEELGDRIRADQKAYRATSEGRQVMRQGGRRYRARKLEAEGEFTDEEFIELCGADNFRCQGCGRVFPQNKLEADHMTPLSRGGSDSLANIEPLCRSCNAGKGTKTKEEWILSYVEVVI